MFRKFVALFFLILYNAINAQLTDLARLEYSYIPKKNSGDEYIRLRALVNYPIEIKKDVYFIVGAQYNRIYLNLRDNYPFDKSLLETITVLDINLGYTYKMNEKWRAAFKITPRLASTLNGKITNEDLFLNGGVFFIKDRRNIDNVHPYRLILGLTYNTTAGIPFPLPLISYFREINDKWSYTIGVPKMNLKYGINENNNIQTFVALDGYFAHLQKPTEILGKKVDNISLSVVASGFGYEHLISKHLVAYSYAGYTLRLNNILRNNNRDNIFTLDNLNSFYLRTGIKFKI